MNAREKRSPSVARSISSSARYSFPASASVDRRAAGALPGGHCHRRRNARDHSRVDFRRLRRTLGPSPKLHPVESEHVRCLHAKKTPVGEADQGFSSMRKAPGPPLFARRALWQGDARSDERASDVGLVRDTGTSQHRWPRGRPGRFASALQDLGSQVHRGAYSTW